MGMRRRQFLKHGLLVGGGTAAGIAAAPKVGGWPGGGGEPGHGSGTVALGVDGRLVRIEAGAATAGNGVAAAAAPARSDEARQGVPGRRWVMVIDLAGCDGCGDCTEACSAMHAVPGDREWLRVLKMRDAPAAAPYWFPRPCMQCDEPPCTKVCPVDGTFKRQDGIVLVDNERCIGCRFCMAACPYSARVFNWGRPEDPPETAGRPYSPESGVPRRVGTVEKCDFCPDHARAGRLPPCVDACAMGVIYFGDENEDAVTNGKGETLQFSRLLRDRAGYRHLEKLGTKPRVYYLPPTPRRYPAPGEEVVATSAAAGPVEEGGRG